MNDSKYQIDLLTALNERLMNSEKMYRHIAECTGNLFVYFDFKITPARVSFIGPWDDTLGGKISNHPYDESYLLHFINEEDQDEFRKKILEIERNKLSDDSMEVRSKNNNKWFIANAYVKYDAEDYATEKIIELKDITKNKINSEELEYLAYYDPLTGVYNRNCFIKNLRNMCEKADKEQTSVEVLFLDIDNFKRINDSIGLIYGDELVQEFGQFLKDFNSEDVNIGRYGSDVFLAAIYNPCGSRSADMIFRKVIERLHHPFALSNKSEIKISVTAGVAEYPDSGKTALDVIKNAEIVLYKTKDDRKGSIGYFDPDILGKYNKTAVIESKLSDSIKNNDFILYYQPMFYSNSGNLRGAEVLLRWPDNNGGFVSEPNEFIPISEKNDTIIALGEYVIKEAIRSLNDWRMKYHVPLLLSINISSLQLESENFVENLQHMLVMYDINPDQIELEIKEAYLVKDSNDFANKLKTLRGIGMKISLDNYGTGYSSINVLKNYPIDTIKLDRTIIDSAIDDDTASLIVDSIIELSKKLGIQTVAEGIEAKDEFNYVRKTKCDILQGYLLGRPMNRADFEKVLIRQMP